MNKRKHTKKVAPVALKAQPLPMANCASYAFDVSALRINHRDPSRQDLVTTIKTLASFIR